MGVGMAWVLAAQSGSTVGLGVPAIVGVLLVADAGVPIPFPTDLLLIVLGERAASGVIPLWAAVLAVEVIAVVSTLVLFHVGRGPGYRLVTRFGRFIGLTAERMARVSSAIEGRGQVGLATGRATPGLRTLTVVAAGGAGLRARRAVPALALGSTIFLQLHVVLGYLVGPGARDLVARAAAPVLVAIGTVAGLAVVAWLIARWRHRRDEAPVLWHEGLCPACLVVAALDVGPPAVARGTGEGVTCP
jgi:membrane protein DedA with SNARE-associated domain